MTAFDLKYQSGLHIGGTVLSFDATRVPGVNILSGATSGSWRVRKALCSEATRDLVRVSKPNFSPLVVPWGRSVAIGDVNVRLVPSGELPGGAMAVVESGNGRLLMAGRVSEGAFGAVLPERDLRADLVAVRCPDLYRGEKAPGRVDALAEISDFAKMALGRGRSACLYVTWPGPAIEVAVELVRVGLPVALSRSMARFVDPYRLHGVDMHGLESEDLAGTGEIVRLKSLPSRWFDPDSPAPGTGRGDTDIAMVVYGVRGFGRGIPLLTCPGTTDLNSVMTLAESSGCRTIVLTGQHAEKAANGLSARGFDTDWMPRREQLILL